MRTAVEIRKAVALLLSPLSPANPGSQLDGSGALDVRGESRATGITLRAAERDGRYQF